MMKNEMEYQVEQNEEKFISPAGNIIGGFALMVGCTYFLMLTISPWVSVLNVLFISLIQYMGLLGILQGFYSFIRGMIGNAHIKIHQFIMVLGVLTSLSGIIILIVLYNHPEIIPFFAFDEHSGTIALAPMPLEIETLKLIIMVLIVLSVLDSVKEMYGVGKLEKYYKK